MRRVVRGAALGLALLAPLVACSSDDPPGRPRIGNAFDTATGLACKQALKPGSFGLFGLVYLRNTSGRPVTLIDAIPVWTGDVTVSNLAVVPYYSPAPGCIRDEHVPGATDIRGTVIPPSAGENDQLYIVPFEVTLDAGRPAGAVVGVEISYEQDGAIARQRWPVTALVCQWGDEPVAPDCDSYKGVDVYNLRFQEALDAVTKLTDA